MTSWFEGKTALCLGSSLYASRANLLSNGDDEEGDILSWPLAHHASILIIPHDVYTIIHILIQGNQGLVEVK